MISVSRPRARLPIFVVETDLGRHKIESRSIPINVKKMTGP